jgi:hypothetical protein
VHYVHNIAAISLAVCIIAVAGANAYRRKEAPIQGGLHPIRFLYSWIAAGMLVISITLLVLAMTGVITVFWLELSVAVMFIIFWIAQTIQLEVESAATAGQAG